MDAQFASTSGSNPFFNPNMWTSIDPEKHMNKSITFFLNEKLTVENDDIRNVFVEHEDGQAIPEYDSTWYDTIDSNKNESNSSDDNDEYTKLTCNDSNLNVRVEHASFEDYNEAHPIDEPIEARHFQKNYEHPVDV